MEVCGSVPRTCAAAALSAENLQVAETRIINALLASPDMARAINGMVGETGMPHTAFLVCPGPAGRLWEFALVKPVSDWAFQRIVEEMRVRGKETAYKFYTMIQNHPSASEIRGRFWELQIQRYFRSCTQTPRRFPVRPLGANNPTAVSDVLFNLNRCCDFSLPQAFEGHLVSSIRDGASSYLQPNSKIFATFDSFLYDPRAGQPGHLPLIGLQITTARKHPINLKGLTKLVESLRRVPELMHLTPSSQSPLIILFIVQKPVGASWQKQDIVENCRVVNSPDWDKKMAQYVLELDPEEVWSIG
jgi:hypothetical protein